MVEYQTNVQIWNNLLGTFPLGPKSTVVDICPGNDPKIERALDNLGYRGRVILIDADRKRLSTLRRELGKTNYDVSEHICTLPDTSIPKGDIVTANHPIDDFIAYHYCDQHGLDYGLMRRDVDHSRRVWEGISQDQDPSVNHALLILESLLKTLEPGSHLIVAQYPSKFEREHRFEDETRICTKVLADFVKRATQAGLVEDQTRVEKAFEGVSSEVYVPSQWRVLRAT